MATQKVDQEPGALERQVARQRRAARSRRMGAVVAAVLLVVAAVAAYKLVEGGAAGVPANRPTTSIQPGAASSMVDLSSGQSTSLPTSIATSGAYYAVSPDHMRLAYNACSQPTGSPLRSERRRDSGTPDLRERMGCLRGAMVCGRLDARISTTAQLDPTAWEPVRPGRSHGPSDATHGFRSDAQLGLVGHLPEFRAGRSLDPLSATARRPQSPDLGPLVCAGHRRYADARPPQRRVGWLLPGRQVARIPFSGQRARFHRRKSLDRRACTGERPEPWLPTGISDG